MRKQDFFQKMDIHAKTKKCFRSEDKDLAPFVYA